MRRLIHAALFAVLALTGAASFTPAQAAPPGPQCGSVMPCEGPIEKITRICQYAYCQFP